MKTVFKYPLPLTNDVQTVNMPVDFKILTLQMQHGVPTIWALVDDNDPPVVSRRFRTIGTGHQFRDSAEFPVYVGTFQVEGGMFIFHVFTEELHADR